MLGFFSYSDCICGIKWLGSLYIFLVVFQDVSSVETSELGFFLSIDLPHGF